MAGAPRIVAVGVSNPPHRLSQREIYELSCRHFEMYRDPRIERIFLSGEIEHRYLSFDADSFDPLASPDDLHARFTRSALETGREAIERCLARAGLGIRDVDALVAVTCTGYLCPGLSARLIAGMGFRDDVERTDLVGMGCAGAMPGLQRAHDYVRARPGRRALVLAVEVSSACWFVDDSLETVVGNAICADGAAAALVAGAEVEGPAIERFETLTDPALLDAVGFRFVGGKLRIVLSKDIRSGAGDLAARAVARLLERAGVAKDSVRHWIVHSGGRRVIDSIREELGLDEERLRATRHVLREHGNMSSPTVLFVLDETLRTSRPAPGDLGVMLALGPGVAAEAALVRW